MSFVISCLQQNTIKNCRKTNLIYLAFICIFTNRVGSFISKLYKFISIFVSTYFCICKHDTLVRYIYYITIIVLY